MFWEEIKKNIDNLKEEKELIDSIHVETQHAASLGDFEKSQQSWRREIENVLKKLREKEILLNFSGKYDRGDAVLTIKSGAGGTDAQDWAEMLLRMYLRYFEQKGFEAKIVDKSPGKEAGIKSAELQVKGGYAFGYLRGEHGIHRLVRLSPFNVAKSRETSFASVEITPLLQENAFEINEKDLKIDTFRSSGPGGQHANVTDSAVRITHLPSGLTVTCQNERSQLQNRETALRILESKLFQLQEEQKKEKMNNIRGERKATSFGSQIRSYVLHPYTMVKDHRTGFSVSDVDKVLDGGLDELIKNYLEWQKMKSQKNE